MLGALNHRQVAQVGQQSSKGMIPVFAVISQLGNLATATQTATDLAQFVPALVDRAMGKVGKGGPSAGAVTVEWLNECKPESRPAWDRASLFLFISVFIEVAPGDDGALSTRYSVAPDDLCTIVLRGYRFTRHSEDAVRASLIDEIGQVSEVLAAARHPAAEPAVETIADNTNHETIEAIDERPAEHRLAVRLPAFLGPIASAGARIAGAGVKRLVDARHGYGARELVYRAAKVLLDAGLSTTEARRALQAQGVDAAMMDRALRL